MNVQEINQTRKHISSFIVTAVVLMGLAMGGWVVSSLIMHFRKLLAHWRVWARMAQGRRAAGNVSRTYAYILCLKISLGLYDSRTAI